MLFLLFSAGNILGQTVKVETTGVQPQTVKLGETAQMIITVKGSENAKILELPEVKGLKIIAGPPSKSIYISSFGFRQVREISLRFTISITPLKTGKFEIPSIRIDVNGEVWKTPRDTLEVVQDFLGMQFGHLEVKVTKKRVFVHEPFTIHAVFGVEESQASRVKEGLSLRLPWYDKLLGALPLEEEEAPGQSELLRIELNGRIMGARKLGLKTVNGKRFYLFRVSRKYLPVEPGEITIGGGFLHFQLVTRYGRDIWGDRVPVEVQRCTVPGKMVKVQVKPLPEEGRPENFSGAVGNFTLEADADPRDVMVGESVKLKVTIKGQGNFGFFKAPDLVDLKDFRLYGKTEEKKSDRLEVTYDLAPLKVEANELPRVPFVYFDTGKERYRTIKTKSIHIKVRPLPKGKGLPELTSKGPKVTPGVDDILDIKVFTPSSEDQLPDRFSKELAVLGIGGPPLLWVLFLFVLKRRERMLEDPRAVRRKKAYKTLRKAMRDAHTIEDVARGFETFLADLWAVPLPSIQGGGWRNVLGDHPAEGNALEEISVFMERLDGISETGVLANRALTTRIAGLL